MEHNLIKPINSKESQIDILFLFKYMPHDDEHTCLLQFMKV